MPKVSAAPGGAAVYYPHEERSCQKIPRCILHGVYTMDGVLIGLFDTYSQVIDFVLKARHRVINMRSLLLQAADECRRFGEFIERFSDQAGMNVKG